MLSSMAPLQNDEDDISYDAGSLFTNFPIDERVNYIIEQMQVQKKLIPICLKLIFRGLLLKLATKCTFKFKNRFLKQVGGFTMSGTLSVTSSGIYMVKIENNTLIPSKTIFYRWFVDDIYNRRKIGNNFLFNHLKNYHPNTKFFIEANPSKFLDTKLTKISGFHKFSIYRKSTKLPSPWTSTTSKRQKRNKINGDLQRAKIISSNFDE